jgi:hypothetical protein
MKLLSHSPAKALSKAGACQAPLQETQTTDIPALEAEIDRFVYQLYGLTDNEIAVVEGKQS